MVGDGQQICDMPLRTTLKKADNWSKTNNENAQKEARSFKSHEKKPFDTLEWVHTGFDKSGRSMWEATLASYRQGLVIEEEKHLFLPLS